MKKISMRKKILMDNKKRKIEKKRIEKILNKNFLHYSNLIEKFLSISFAFFYVHNFSDNDIIQYFENYILKNLMDKKNSVKEIIANQFCGIE